MTDDLVPYNKNQIITANDAITAAGQTANTYARKTVFDEFLATKSENTRDAYLADLDTFALYLRQATNDTSDITGAELSLVPGAWAGITWGLIEGYKRWLLYDQHYAVTSINRKLSTVRSFAEHATKAAVLAPEELQLINTVHGYSRRESINLDKDRPLNRVSNKKAEWTRITPDQARALKDQPDTAQGRRDALMMCLFLDHGLRCGEVAILQVGDFDTKRGTFTFYRPKIDKKQTMEL